MREIILGHTPLGILLHILVAAVILTILGPFGTFDSFSFPSRFAFWLSSIIAAGIFIHTAVSLLVRRAQETVRSALIWLTIGLVVGSIPAAAVVMLIFSFFQGTPLNEISYLLVWINVLIISILVSFAKFAALAFKNLSEVLNTTKETKPVQTETSEAIVERSAQENVAASNAKSSPPEVPLLGLLSADTRPEDIISFSMQDHYVNFTTTKGSQMILMRFSDALEQLGDLEGLRLHRSHWAACDHIVHMNKKDRKYEATLSDNRKLPVSTTYAANVAALLKAKSAA